MALNRAGFMNWLMNHFTYDQKYTIAGVVRGIGFVLLWWTLYQLIYMQSNTIENQIHSNSSQESWQRLYHSVVEHALLSSQYKSKQLDVQDQLIQIEEEVRDQIRQLSTSSANQSKKELRLMRRELEQEWNQIEANTFRDLPDVSGQILFLDRLRKEMKNHWTSSDLSADALQTGYLILEDVNQRLRSIQTVAQKLEQKDTKIQDKELLFIQLQMPLVTQGFDKSVKQLAKAGSSLALEKHIKTLMQEYTQAIEALITYARQSTGTSIKNIIQLSFSLRESIARELDQVLEERKSAIQLWKYWIFAISLFLIVAGCYLGLNFVYEAIKGFISLEEGTKKLTSGDLTVRLPIIYDDEIGAATSAFNHMAHNFENMITQQRRLFEATKELVGGDFSARVKIEENADEELTRASLSFNRMAQSFEEMMSHLHRLGINLTTSTHDIKEASERQEKLILEQDKTTREILGTASQISSTAEEFAATIYEVSEVAEKTSKLASGGQDSLINMEVTMRQMVEASANISKMLSALNQKAQHITRVVTTIAKVADQTNLLSLNASIEAESTGTYKSRFLKIADEIRRLADETAVATLDIRNVINQIMTAVSSCVTGVQDFDEVIHTGAGQLGEVGEQMGKIIVQVQALAFRFESVNEGMQKQKIQAKSINEGMNSLSQSAEQTTESLASFRTTIEKLSIAAKDLKNAFSTIKCD